MNLDRYYTPSNLVKTMLRLVPPSSKIGLIADFAAGEGALLFAAENRWPKANIIGNDLDKQVARRIRMQRPRWQVTAGDFLGEMYSNESKCHEYLGNVDLILLNPPFTQKHRPWISIEFAGSECKCSLAMAFVIQSLKFLKSDGFLIVVLPNGALKSQRDSGAWELIRINHKVRVLFSKNSRLFAGADVNTAIVTLTRRKSPLRKAELNKKSQEQMAVFPRFEILRGNVALSHRFRRAKHDKLFPLIHTTNLIGGKINFSAARLVNHATFLQGPAILIPRVGRLSKSKITLLGGNRQVVLTDCVIAVKFDSLDLAKQAKAAILSRWELFASAYCGTGAAYTTLSAMRGAINKCLQSRKVLKPAKLVSSLRYPAA